MIFGIDFGTSNTVVSAGGEVRSRILSLGEEGGILPSLMYFDSEGRLSIGTRARGDYSGALTRGGDPYKKFRLFQALKFALRDPLFEGTKLFGRRWSVEQLVGTFLRELRKLAEAETGETAELIVLGRPVRLSPDPRWEDLLAKRFRSACALAGFGEIRFVPEPVAAMSDIAGSGDGRALIFDFGGGTLDITVASIERGKVRVLANAGADIGGYLLNEDISRARIIRHFGYGSTFRTMTGKELEIPRWITNQVASFYALPLADIVHTRAVVRELLSESRDRRRLLGLIEFLDRNQAYRLFERIDEAKIELSAKLEASIAFDLPPHVVIDECLTRCEFEGIVSPRLAAAESLVLHALSLAKLKPGEVERVVRVGGSSRIPAFAAMLDSIFPGRVSEGEVFTSISAGLIGAYESGLSAA